MKTAEMRLGDQLGMIWAIALKDIQEAIKNKNTRINILFMLGYVAFFYWLSTPRPFDKQITVILWDQGNSGLTATTIQLSGDASIRLMTPVKTMDGMVRSMAFQELGLVLPADFSQQMEGDGKIVLEGYIPWAKRSKAAELETLYSEKFSEWLQRPVSIEIADRFVQPPYDVQATTAHSTILFVMFFLGPTLVPFLMLEEKRTRTMDALLVSPASFAQVVWGKALAGLFYIVLTGGVAFVFYRMYVVNWVLVVPAFVGTALTAVLVGLLVGVFVQKGRQVNLWIWPIVILLLLPAFFAQESFIPEMVRKFFNLVPTAALGKLIQYSFSDSVPAGVLVGNLALAVAGILLLYGVIVWRLRRSDR